MRHLIIKTAFATTLGIAAVSSAFAYADDENTRFSATTSEPTANERAPYGYLTNGQPERIVTLGKDANKYLNVTRMETIRINVAGKSVTWNFDTLGTPTFLLSDIIPEAKGIRVYVSEKPIYLGG
ncbi:CzcE family metal-binding protein [Methyloversatilis sp.]|jgi:hypothetical protein|uniref:CzcE family metal-binding protein n=1 Tax=Methyloversatilis sp. TaxID=2569862 RepID=UPI002736E1CC|nr:CzcE family metal-binding protein [Methyloversatilis sp.]MDP3455894.1 CzcE family metal-binding protein [Methyloversatilis sp.]